METMSTSQPDAKDDASTPRADRFPGVRELAEQQQHNKVDADVEVVMESQPGQVTRPLKSRASDWIAGARPRTLPAAVVPVFVGTAIALNAGEASWVRYVLCLIVALGLQIGVNYANDYSDGVRGSDDDRIGPKRLVASKSATPIAVRNAAFVSFVVASLAGVALAFMSSLWLIPIGIGAVGAAWLYTGGEKPYGYSGFGELAVFVFFGVVAVLGTTYAQMESLPAIAYVVALPVGLHSVALLLVNNLRDIASDEEVGKKTLAVRLGDAKTRTLFVACVTVPFVIAFLIGLNGPTRGVLLTLLALLVLPPSVGPVREKVTGKGLIAVLGATGRLQLVFGLLFAVGLAA